MKKIVLISIVLITIAVSFSACEETEYRHPFHRTSGK